MFQFLCNNRDQTWFFNALTFARSLGMCWKLRPPASVFNSLGTWWMLMHEKPCLIPILTRLNYRIERRNSIGIFIISLCQHITGSHLNCLLRWSDEKKVSTLSIGIDRPEQIVYTQTRCQRMQHTIRVYTVCHLDMSTSGDFIKCYFPTVLYLYALLCPGSRVKFWV